MTYQGILPDCHEKAAFDGCFPYGRWKKIWIFMYKIKQEYRYLIFILLILIGVFQYGIQKICGFTMYPDEFGYWASAAKVVGYDWTEVASMGSYYSFGYSVLLIPLLKLFSDGVSAYRAALAVNLLLMCVSVLLLWNIIYRLFPEIDRMKRAFISGIAVFYPSWIFYMQMTLAEALLMFLFVALTSLFISFIQKPRVMTAVILAVLLIYTYCVHMRSIGVVIACLTTLLFWGLSNPAKRKTVLIALGVIAIAGLIVVIIKRNVIMSVFSKADAETLAVNDYSSQMWKIRQILNPDGFSIFIKEIIAKVFYLGMASFGIAYWAIGWSIKETFGLIKRIADAKHWVAMFLLLSVVGEILICTIYMHGSVKIDCLVYGRYNEFLVPILVAVGIVVMLQSRWLLQITLVAGTVSGVMLFPILSVIEEEKLDGIRGYFIVGISYLINEDNFNPYLFFRDAWILGFALMILMAGIICISRRLKDAGWMLGIIIIVEVVLGIMASAHYTYEVNKSGFLDLVIAEKIIENRDENTKVTYLDEGAPEFIDFQQMQLPDISIHVIKGEAAEQMDELGDFLIVCHDTKQREELEHMYDTHIMTNSFILYFNQKN